MTVTLRGPGITEEQVVAVARHREQVALSPAARTRMERSRTRAERASASREPVYGVSTGFGALAGTRVAPLRQPELQLALDDNPAGKAYQQALLQQGQPAAMFFTDDVKADFERIKSRGAEFTMPPNDVTGSTIAQLDDTCGNLLQITQLARW